MDTLNLTLDSEYIDTKLHPSWRDLYFGFKERLIGNDVLRRVAAKRRGGESEAEASLIDQLLNSAGDTEYDLQILADLAALESTCSNIDSEVKWLYLVLAWIYEHRIEFPDALQMVEEAYAHFGYPPAVSSFVRYMPMEGPDLGSREANEARLYERWSGYLEFMSTNIKLDHCHT